MVTDLETILSTLLFHPKWIEHGLLPDDFLQSQFLLYQTSDDKNTEHYRFRAFGYVLANTETLDDQALDHYIELATLDDDKTMGEAALGLLVRWSRLTDSQLDRLKTHPVYSKPFLQKLIKRMEMLRELASTGLTDEAFERFVSDGDAEVHRALLSRPELTRAHLEVLRERGANKAIRNVAASRLRSGKLMLT
jgi:hypothetical protein